MSTLTTREAALSSAAGQPPLRTDRGILSGMTPEMDEGPQPISEAIPEAMLRIMRPDLLTLYQAEKKRHREEIEVIEAAMTRAQRSLRRLFGPLKERRETDLEADYLERKQGEADRHDRFMQELREMIHDHRNPDRAGKDDDLH